MGENDRRDAHDIIFDRLIDVFVHIFGHIVPYPNVYTIPSVLKKWVLLSSPTPFKRFYKLSFLNMTHPNYSISTFLR